jgi:type 1 fimbria pilin
MKGVMKYIRARPHPLFHLPLQVGLLLTLSTSFFVAADTLTFTVTATVVEPSCSLAPGNSALEINMADLNSAELESNGYSKVMPFSIKLEKCANTGSAKVKFSSTTSTGNGTFNPTGVSRGFVLGFTDREGGQVLLDKDIVMPLQQGSNELTFGVQARRDKSSAFVLGDFTAQATLTIAYQ